MPTGEQARRLRRFSGACRSVFNRALALQRERQRQGDSHLGYAAPCRQLTAWPDPQQVRLDQDNGRIFLPKLGWLRYRASRDVLGEVRNVTVSQSGGKWFASIQTQRELPTLAGTFCTKPRRRSAETTRSYALRICRYGI